MESKICNGNPVTLCEEDAYVLCDAILASNIVVTVGAERFEMEANGTRKTLKYPAGADVRWALEQVRKFADVTRKAFKAQNATSKRFVQLCADVLKDGGDVTFGEKRYMYPYQQVVDVVKLHLIKEKGHTFDAECEASTLGDAGIEHVKRLIAEEMERREGEKRKITEEQELRRLREFARKHNVK